MRHFILAAALALASGTGLAFEITCDRPEYLQLKTADKAELEQEFCSRTRMHDVNMKLRATTQSGISELRAIGADVAKHVARSEVEMNAAMSCLRAAAEYAGALERRFKIKPPAVKACLSPGGI